MLLQVFATISFLCIGLLGVFLIRKYLSKVSRILDTSAKLAESVEAKD